MSYYSRLESSVSAIQVRVSELVEVRFHFSGRSVFKGRQQGAIDSMTRGVYFFFVEIPLASF